MRDKKWDPPEVPEPDEGGEPATKDDEFAREDAPEQKYEDD